MYARVYLILVLFVFFSLFIYVPIFTYMRSFFCLSFFIVICFIARNQSVGFSRKKIADGFDQKSELSYRVTTDGNDLHVSLVTSHFPTIEKILKCGLKVYFNQRGKHKKNLFIHYPLNPSSDLNAFIPYPLNNVPYAMILNQEIKRIGIGVVLVRDDVHTTFTTHLPAFGISVLLSSPDSGVLRYDIVLPLGVLISQDHRIGENFSIGIETGSFDVIQTPSNPGADDSPSNVSKRGIPQSSGVSNSSSIYAVKNRNVQNEKRPHHGFTVLNQSSKFWFNLDPSAFSPSPTPNVIHK